MCHFKDSVLIIFKVTGTLQSEDQWLFNYLARILSLHKVLFLFETYILYIIMRHFCIIQRHKNEK